MRSEAKGWYEAERGLDARGGPDAWRGNRRPGAGAIGLCSRGERAVSRGGFVLPALPENWADLPFTLYGFPELRPITPTSMVLRLASPCRVKCSAISRRRPMLGFSTKANVYGQQLYLDTTFGVIRYLHQTGFDSNVYSVSAGDNWTLTSRCSGNLGVTLSKSPVEITEVVATSAGTGVNYATTTAFNETGKCAVSNGYSVLFNTSWSEITNSNPIDAINNSRTTMLSAGIEYAKGPEHPDGAGEQFRDISTTDGLDRDHCRIGQRYRFSYLQPELYSANQSQSFRNRVNWIGRGHRRIHLGSAQDAAADLYVGRRRGRLRQS